MMTVNVFAPAKINLALHVTGQTEGGYHLLDTLVAFASVGDEVLVRESETLSLTVEGPEADGIPTGEENLALKAAKLLIKEAGAHLTLTKRLPSASGIGGGSADAAAAFRALLAFGEKDKRPAQRMWAMPDVVFKTHAREMLALGADVPMCLLSRPVRARGIGEKLQFLTVPPISAVLVNPRVPLSTPDVFKLLTNKSNPPMPDHLPDFQTDENLIAFLSDARNDLEDPAIALAPILVDVLQSISDLDGCRLARMSGSGATCFGLFEDPLAAGEAASILRQSRPEWWVSNCWLGDQMMNAMPKEISAG